MSGIPTLETERLILRPFAVADFPVFAELCADAELMRFVGGVMDRHEAWRRMATYTGQWALRGYGVWALEEKSSGALVGYSGVNDPEGFPEREINWGVMRAALGRGFATEAATRVRAYTYETLKFDRIVSCIADANTASQNVAQRLGATREKAASFKGHPMGIWRHLTPRELQSGGAG